MPMDAPFYEMGLSPSITSSENALQLDLLEAIFSFDVPFFQITHFSQVGTKPARTYPLL